MKAHTCSTEIAIAGLVETVLFEVCTLADRIAVLADTLKVFKIA
jgi:hypothetical protein